jgi:hypothetical protein
VCVCAGGWVMPIVHYKNKEDVAILEKCWAYQ